MLPTTTISISRKFYFFGTTMSSRFCASVGQPTYYFPPSHWSTIPLFPSHRKNKNNFTSRLHIGLKTISQILSNRKLVLRLWSYRLARLNASNDATQPSEIVTYTVETTEINWLGKPAQVLACKGAVRGETLCLHICGNGWIKKEALEK